MRNVIPRRTFLGVVAVGLTACASGTARAADLVPTPAQTEGPFLLAKLPPGRYAIEVTAEGQTQRKQAHVTGSGHAREVFVFNNLP